MISVGGCVSLLDGLLCVHTLYVMAILQSQSSILYIIYNYNTEILRMLKQWTWRRSWSLEGALPACDRTDLTMCVMLFVVSVLPPRHFSYSL